MDEGKLTELSKQQSGCPEQVMGNPMTVTGVPRTGNKHWSVDSKIG